jgi:ATP-dependent DNA helicase RecG
MARVEDRLKGVIGDRTADALLKIFGMVTIEDLLRHYPRRYVVRGELSDISELLEGDEVTVLAEVAAVKTRRANGRHILEVNLTDGSAVMALTFFNQPWREKELRIGKVGMFAGKVGSFNGKRQLSHPDYQLIPDGDDVDSALAGFAGKFLPVYPAGGKMPSWKISQCIELVLDSLDEINDHLPESVIKEFGYPTLKEALIAIHRPESLQEADLARMRLTFDEAILLQLLLAQRRAELKALAATPREISLNGLVRTFESRLPFIYTEGQIEVNKEIELDMQQSHPMHRLLQGEVGSGKTVLALRAMLSVIESGGQAALLAPTEVLAMQHFKTITKLMGDLAEAGTLQGNGEGTQIALLTGSLTAGLKREALGKISNGEAGIVIGTHALISDGVDFRDLALVVVDEQHRFGVEQRDALRMKAIVPPHLLVMTATPIPRTVAMTIFGDLDISTLRQLPSGRIPIETHVIPVLEKPHYLQRAWERVKEEVGKGHQAYIVVPRISGVESSETNIKISEGDIAMAKLMGDEISGEELFGSENMTSVEELAPELAVGALKGLKLAPLHGRLSAEDKDATMSAFSSGEIDVLVATTVIEVGVDVPNASMMVIMDADRFGVSQLHQLRGRVGRGGIPGLCLLVSSAADGSPAMERMTAVAGTLDGFELSRIDLDQRREGDVLGRAQSGTKSHLRLLRVLRDEKLIEESRRVAQELIREDPKLEKHTSLAAQVALLKEEEGSAFLDKG